MDGCNRSVKEKPPYIKERMAQADPQPVWVKKMNSLSLLLLSNKMTTTLKSGQDCKWCYGKDILSLQKFDASNRFS